MTNVKQPSCDEGCFLAGHFSALKHEEGQSLFALYRVNVQRGTVPFTAVKS